MNQSISAPTQMISKDAVKVWRITSTIEHVIFFIILFFLLFLARNFDWYEWIHWILIVLIVLNAVSAIIFIFLQPIFLQKFWRYEVTEEFVQTKKGAWKVSHELIPMTKVQSVELIQGPFLRRYKLCTIQIRTMGSSHDIPAIPETEAEELRDQIAYFAKIKEVE